MHTIIGNVMNSILDEVELRNAPLPNQQTNAEPTNDAHKQEEKENLLQNWKYCLGGLCQKKTMQMASGKKTIVFCSKMLFWDRRNRKTTKTLLQNQNPVTVYGNLQGTFIFAGAVEGKSRPSTDLAVIFMHEQESIMVAPLKEVQLNEGFAPTPAKSLLIAKTREFLKNPIQLEVPPPLLEKKIKKDNKGNKQNLVPERKHFLRERKKATLTPISSPSSPNTSSGEEVCINDVECSENENEKENAPPPPSLKKKATFKKKRKQSTAAPPSGKKNATKSQTRIKKNRGASDDCNDKKASTDGSLQEIKDMLIAQNCNLQSEMNLMKEEIQLLKQSKVQQESDPQLPLEQQLPASQATAVIPYQGMQMPSFPHQVSAMQPQMAMIMPPMQQISFMQPQSTNNMLVQQNTAQQQFNQKAVQFGMSMAQAFASFMNN
mmetsp:Transcript_41902/g.54015  ORF Transcript_41902/g.54015 Transcript_41902/m.54015 type:complete len:433 (-) Transcript_41902:124-1422(-)